MRVRLFPENFGSPGFLLGKRWKNKDFR